MRDLEDRGEGETLFSGVAVELPGTSDAASSGDPGSRFPGIPVHTDSLTSSSHLPHPCPQLSQWLCRPLSPAITFNSNLKYLEWLLFS